MSITAELLSLAETAIHVTIYLGVTITCMATFFAAGYWIGSPLGAVVLHLLSNFEPAPLVEPHLIPVTSRRLGVGILVVFFFCGLAAEVANLPPPESMSLGDFGVWSLRAAVIGFIVMATVNGMVVVAGKVRRWVMERG